jgi:hypothetical protein
MAGAASRRAELSAQQGHLQGLDKALTQGVHHQGLDRGLGNPPPPARVRKRPGSFKRGDLYFEHEI